MKKAIPIFAILAILSEGLIANPMNSFKVCTHLGPHSDMIPPHISYPYYNSGIDINTLSNRHTFNVWCSDNARYYGTPGPYSGGYGAGRWYSRGFGLIGRYVDWWACADSLALWDTLNGLYADSFKAYIESPEVSEGFAMYRLMDGDSSYTYGTSMRFAADGFERLYGRLDDPNLSLPRGYTNRHYTYFWGSLNWPPYGASQILDWMPHLDLGGPGAYVFSDGVATQDALDALVDGCQTYASTMRSKNRGLMILLQCGREKGDAPTFSELRASSWLALAHGNAWLGYYSYRVGQAIFPEDGVGAAVGVIEGNKSGSLQRPYVTNPAEYNQLFDPDLSTGDFNTNANYWMNLYDVIDEIKEVGDHLAELNWEFGISGHIANRPFEGEYSFVWDFSGADYVDFGLFDHLSDDAEYLIVVNREQVEKTISVYIKYLGKDKLRVTNLATDYTTTASLDQATGCYIFTKDYGPGQGMLFKLEPYGEEPKLALTGEWREHKVTTGYMNQFVDDGGNGGGTDLGYAYMTWEWTTYVPPTLERMYLYRRDNDDPTNWWPASQKPVSNPALMRTGHHCVEMIDSFVQFVEIGEHPDGEDITWPPYTGLTGTRSNFKGITYRNEGGCPALYSFYHLDTLVEPGYVFAENNTILPHSQHTDQVIGEDLLRLDVLNTDPDHYYMAIAENDDEVSYLDQVKLWVVDHNEGTQVATSADGNCYVYSDWIAPASCIDNQSVDRLEDVSWEDTFAYRGLSSSYLAVSFDDPGWSGTGLLMSLGDWSEQAPVGKDYEVMSSKPGPGGTWDSIGSGYARLNHSQWMVDVSDCDSFTFRVYCGGSDTCRIDRIALVKLEDDWTQTEAVLDSAVLHYVNGTKEIVTVTLLVDDTFHVQLIPNYQEQISLRFDKIDTSFNYPLRNYVFQSRGFYIPVNPPGSPETGVEEVPLEYGLSIEQVEPLSRNSLINYSIPEQAYVKIGIYDVSGRLVKTVVNEQLIPGRYSQHWPGSDNAGRRVASGIYFVKMETDNFRQTNKIVILE